MVLINLSVLCINYYDCILIIKGERRERGGATVKSSSRNGAAQIALFIELYTCYDHTPGISSQEVRATFQIYGRKELRMSNVECVFNGFYKGLQVLKI